MYINLSVLHSAESCGVFFSVPLHMTSLDTSKADALKRSAFDHSKPSFFRWNPDWQKTAEEYEAAARLYSKFGTSALSDLIDCYKGAAEAHEMMQSLNTAAKMMENAARMEEKIPNIKSACESYKATAKLLVVNGQPVLAAQKLMVAGNLAAQAQDVELAVNLYTHACEVFEKDEEHHLQSYETFKITVGYLIKVDMARDALAILDRLVGMYMYDFDNKKKQVYRAFLGMIIICLSLHDVELGFSTFERVHKTEGWMESEESSLANELLIAFDEADAERLAEAIKDPTLTLLDVAIAKTVKALRITEEDRRLAIERQQKKDADEEPDLT